MASQRKPIRRFVLKHMAPPVAIGLIRGLGRTWRYEPERRELHESCMADSRPVIAAFLHARVLPLLHFMSRPENGRWVIMCSKSRDGDFMAQVELGLGYKVVRGSTGGGGARGLIEMIRLVKKDPSLQSCLGIDGSRGPRGVAQLGIITAAQKTNALILPVAASAERCTVWTRSWDRMILPHPRTTIKIVFGQPIEIPESLDSDQVEKSRQSVERAVLDVHTEADELAGFHDTEPLREGVEVNP